MSGRTGEFKPSLTYRCDKPPVFGAPKYIGFQFPASLAGGITVVYAFPTSSVLPTTRLAELLTIFLVLNLWRSFFPFFPYILDICW